MINEHIVIGSKLTSWHNFMIDIDELRLVISDGEYWRAGKKIFESTKDTVLTFTRPGEYNVWVTGSGIIALNKNTEPEFAVDRLAWLTITKNIQSLDEVDIDCVIIKE